MTKEYITAFIREQDAKVQTCVLPQSDFQPLLWQSRTHFCILFSNEEPIYISIENLKIKPEEDDKTS